MEAKVERPRTFDSLRMRLLIAITAGYGLSYTCRLAIGVVKKPLIDGHIFSPDELGMIGSTLFVAYAVGKFFNGFIADHLNVRLFVAGGFVASAVCNLAMGCTTNAYLAALLWGLNGWFQSFGAPGCIIALASAFTEQERGRAYGIWSTSHSLGEGLTFLAVGSIAGALGWRAGFFGAAFYGIAAAALVMLLLPRHIPGRPRRPARGGAGGLALVRKQLVVLKLWPVWLLGLASAANYVTRYGINSWGFLYLEEARGFSVAAAGTALMVSNLAGIAGSLAYGYASDLAFGGRRPPANLLFALVEIVGLAMTFYLPGALGLWTGLILFGLGMGAINAGIGGLFAVDLVPRRVVGAVAGLMGTFSYLGSAMEELVSGGLINRSSAVVAGVRHYDFAGAELFWLAAAIVSLLVALPLWRVSKPEGD